MLPKSKRLSTELFNKIIKNGLYMNSPLLSLRLTKNSKMSHFAVSVPKKVAKSAVLRNKIRRRIYSVIKRINLNNTLSGYDVVIIAKNGLEKLSFAALAQEIEKIFVKSGILK